MDQKDTAAVPKFDHFAVVTRLFTDAQAVTTPDEFTAGLMKLAERFSSADMERTLQRLSISTSSRSVTPKRKDRNSPENLVVDRQQFRRTQESLALEQAEAQDGLEYTYQTMDEVDDSS